MIAEEGEEGGYEDNTEIPKFWNADNYDAEVETTAMRRLNGIIGMSAPGTDPHTWRHDDERKYGIGKVRSPDLFYRTFGIDVKNRTMEMNLCMFVASVDMHDRFKPALRENGMGIDYELLDGFEFENRWPLDGWWHHRGDPEMYEAWITDAWDDEVEEEEEDVDTNMDDEDEGDRDDYEYEE